MLELIQKLNKTSLCTFAALCDGNVVTTSGYNITADLCVNRASAVAHSLKKISAGYGQNDWTKADVGGAVQSRPLSVLMKAILQDLNQSRKR